MTLCVSLLSWYVIVRLDLNSTIYLAAVACFVQSKGDALEEVGHT